MKDRLLTLLKVAVSLGLIIYLFAFKVDLGAVVKVLAQAKPLYVLLALALYFVAVAVGSTKWQLILRLQGIRVPLPSLLSYTFVGLFFGNFLLGFVPYKMWGAVFGLVTKDDMSQTTNSLKKLVAFEIVALASSAACAGILSNVVDQTY